MTTPPTPAEVAEARAWFERRRTRYGTGPEYWIADGGDGQGHAAVLVRAVLAAPADRETQPTEAIADDDITIPSAGTPRTWDDALDLIPAYLRNDADVLVKWVVVDGGEPMHALYRLLRALACYRADVGDTPSSALADAEEICRLRAALADTTRDSGAAPAEQPCVREGLTPDIDGGTDTLIVDCSVHGEIGRIPADRHTVRDGEYADAEELFAQHVAARSVSPSAVPAVSDTSPSAGRDLTAQDVAVAFDMWHCSEDPSDDERAAEHLNRIARPADTGCACCADPSDDLGFVGDECGRYIGSGCGHPFADHRRPADTGTQATEQTTEYRVTGKPPVTGGGLDEDEGISSSDPLTFEEADHRSLILEKRNGWTDVRVESRTKTVSTSVSPWSPVAVHDENGAQA